MCESTETRKCVWKNANNLVRLKHKVQVGRGKLSPHYKDSSMLSKKLWLYLQVVEATERV